MPKKNFKQLRKKMPPKARTRSTKQTKEQIRTLTTEVKKIPRTVGEAWDAMKAANELPRMYKVAWPVEDSKPEPIRSEIDNSKPVASEVILRRIQQIKETCPHTKTSQDAQGNAYFTSKLNIKWHEHSNGIVMGVCGTCFSQFDTRSLEDADWLQKDPKAKEYMGRAGKHAVGPPAVEIAPTKKLTLWQRFKNLFSWN